MTARPGQLTDRPTLPILSSQPEPMQTRVAYVRIFGFVLTAIMRHWRPGDAGRCKLCPRCRAYDDGCLMIFGRRIAKADAPLASSRGTVEAEEPRIAAKSVS
jgi:hypothetical protein